MLINPITLQIPNSKISPKAKTIVLYTPHGQGFRHKQAQVGIIQWELRDLEAGMYVLRLTTSERAPLPKGDHALGLFSQNVTSKALP
jgi:hypothetical protein